MDYIDIMGNDFVHYKHFEKGSSSIPNSCIKNIIIDDNKQLWAFTFDDQYAKYSYDHDDFYNVPELKLDPIIIDRLKSNSTKLYSERRINGYSFSVKNNQLISYNKELNQKYYYFEDHLQPGKLKDDLVSCFYIDDQNILWIGTKLGTIFKVNANRKQFSLNYVYEEIEEDLAQRPVRAIIKYKNQLWIGTEYDKIVIYENGKALNNHPFHHTSCTQTNVRCFYEDEYGKLWIGSKQGIVNYDPVTKRCKSILNKQDFPDSYKKYVYSIAKSRDKDFVWASIYNNLLRINIKTKKYQSFNLQKNIGSNYIMDVLEDELGGIWIATEGEGIFKVTFNSKYQINDVSQIKNPLYNNQFKEYTGNMVYSLFNDKRGHIWGWNNRRRSFLY